MDLEQLFIDNKEQSITGRYPLESIEPILQRLNTDNQLSVVGKSTKTNLSLSDWRRKNKKYWSQMHGNESTTTKRCLTS
jgi:hypothetical protein